MNHLKLVAIGLLFGSLTFGGHESHGDGGFVVVGFARLMGEVSDAILPEAKLQDIRPERLERLRTGWWSCRLKPQLSARVIFSFTEVSEKNCVIAFGPQAWSDLRSARARWIATCEALVDYAGLYTGGAEYCETLQKTNEDEKIYLF